MRTCVIHDVVRKKHITMSVTDVKADNKCRGPREADSNITRVDIAFALETSLDGTRFGMECRIKSKEQQTRAVGRRGAKNNDWGEVADGGKRATSDDERKQASSGI